jgi:hypothetical protein
MACYRVNIAFTRVGGIWNLYIIPNDSAPRPAAFEELRVCTVHRSRSGGSKKRCKKLNLTFCHFVRGLALSTLPKANRPCANTYCELWRFWQWYNKWMCSEIWSETECYSKFQSDYSTVYGWVAEEEREKPNETETLKPAFGLEWFLPVHPWSDNAICQGFVRRTCIRPGGAKNTQKFVLGVSCVKFHHWRKSDVVTNWKQRDLRAVVGSASLCGSVA